MHYTRSSDVRPPSIVLSSLRTSPLPTPFDFITLGAAMAEDSITQTTPVQPSQARVVLDTVLTEDVLERGDPEAVHRWLAAFPLPTPNI